MTINSSLLFDTSTYFANLEKQYDELVTNNHRPYFFKNYSGEVGFTSYSSCLSLRVYQLFGHTLDLQKTLPFFIGKAKELVQSIKAEQSQLSQSELRSMLKVLGVTYALNQKSLLNAQQYTEKKRILTNSLQEQYSTIQNGLKLLSQIEQKSIVQLSFDLALIRHAFDFICKDHPFHDISTENLQKIVPFCIQEKKYDLILDLVGMNVPIPLGSVHSVLLTQLALKNTHTKALIGLILQGIPLQAKYTEITSPHIPLLCLIAEKGMTDALHVAIEKGASLGDTDSYGNTALYYAFLSHSISASKLLLQKIDPTIRNRQGKTALEMYLGNQTIYTIEEKRAFLVSLLSRKTTRFLNMGREQRAIILHKIALHDLAIDLFEIQFLLGRPLLDNLGTREELAESCEILKTLYSPHSVLCFEVSHFTLINDQYKYGVESFTPTGRPENTKIQDLSALYEGLNLTNPTQAHYLDPNPLQKVMNASNLQQVSSALDVFITTIATRKAFKGTPTANTPALKDFYDLIELHLLHVIATLKKKNDPYRTYSCIKELIAASSECGGRYYSVAIEQYLRICLEKVETPLLKLYQSLAEMRSIAFHNAVISTSGRSHNGEYGGNHNVHNHNYALKILGKKYGIPGYQQALQFNDSYLGNNFSIQDIEEKFLQSYTPTNIIIDWIYPLITSDADFKESYIDWHKEHIPSWFQKEKYKFLHKELKKIEKESAPHVVSEQVAEFLRQNDIYIMPHQQAMEAIEDAKKSEYLSTIVYDEKSELTLSGVLYYLEKNAIISSKLPWMDSDKEIIQVQIDQNSFYRPLHSLAKSCLAGIGSVAQSVWQTVSNFF